MEKALRVLAALPLVLLTRLEPMELLLPPPLMPLPPPPTAERAETGPEEINPAAALEICASHAPRRDAGAKGEAGAKETVRWRPPMHRACRRIGETALVGPSSVCGWSRQHDGAARIVRIPRRGRRRMHCFDGFGAFSLEAQGSIACVLPIEPRPDKPCSRPTPTLTSTRRASCQGGGILIHPATPPGRLLMGGP